MTALTSRQRTAINATLALIHSRGHDASAITRQARTAASKGVPLKTAYDQAVQGFMASQPNLSGPIGKIARLVMASDDATVALYADALHAYNSRGDEGPLNALAPMIARDSIALAIRSGELAAGATGADALSASLGADASPAMVAALSAPEPAVSAPQAAPATTPQTFSFAPPAAAAGKPARASNDGSSSGYGTGQGGGVVSAKAMARWARDFPGGIVPEGTRLAPHEQGGAA